jgi:hypothetical protein
MNFVTLVAVLFSVCLCPRSAVASTQATTRPPLPVLVQDGYASSTTPLTSWVPVDPSTVNISSVSTLIRTDRSPLTYTTITYDGAHMWCTSIDGRLVRIDEATMMQEEVFPELRVPRSLNVIALGSDSLWFTSGGAISWVSTTTNNGTLTTLAAKLPECASSGIFHGSVFDGTRYIWTVGYDPCLVRVDVVTGELTGISVATASSVFVHAHGGVVFDGTFVWVVPYASDAPLLRVDPHTSRVHAIPIPDVIRSALRMPQASGRPFRRAVFKAPDSLYLLPFDAQMVVKVNTTTLWMSAIAILPKKVLGDSAKLRVNGAAFDGRYIWMGTVSNGILSLDTVTDVTQEFQSADANAISGCTFTGSAIFCVTSRGRVVKIAPPETSPLLLKHTTAHSHVPMNFRPRRAATSSHMSHQRAATTSPPPPSEARQRSSDDDGRSDRPLLTQFREDDAPPPHTAADHATNSAIGTWCSITGFGVFLCFMVAFVVRSCAMSSNRSTMVVVSKVKAI